MITIIRRNQRVLMLIIAILTIIAFAWLYNPNEMNKLGDNTVARIYGKGLTQADIDREVRNFQLALAMGQYELIGGLGGMAQDERQAVQDFVFNLLVLQHESHQLGVHPTNEQIADLIKTMAVFQTDGQFDPRKYQTFVQEQLGPRGFTELQLENVARDSLRLQRLQDVVSAPVTVSDAEVAEALRVLQKIDLQIVRFPMPDASKVTVSEDEINAYYEKNKASLVSPETRSVRYVEFVLPTNEAGLTGKEKVEALQRLWDKAGAFAEQAATAASFDEAAKAAGLEVKSTPEFDRTGATKIELQLRQMANVESGGSLKAFAPQAFVLSDERTVSDAMQDGDKFYVLKIDKVTPERPLTLDEVKPIADVRLRAVKLGDAAKEQAQSALASLRSAVEGGRPLAEAATALGLKVDTVSGLEPANFQGQNVPVGLVRLSLIMEPAQMSGYLPTGDEGGMAMYLAARAPLNLPADELARQKDEIKKNLLASKGQLLFFSWLNTAREGADLAAVNRGTN